MESLTVVFSKKDTVEVERRQIGEPAEGQVLIQTTKSLISTGTECIMLEANYEADSHWARWCALPICPGYSNIGVIMSVGDGVEGLKPGDRVATRSSHWQYHLIPAYMVTPVPDGVSDEDAAWFALAGITQIGVRTAEHELGDVVVIIGAGPLGQLVVQYVRLAGAREIIVLDLSKERLEMATAHGATHTLQMDAAEATDAVRELTGDRMADVVYDITGHADVFAPATSMVRRFGKLLLLGDTGSPSKQHLTSDVIVRGVKIIAGHDGHPPKQSSDYAFWTHEEMFQLFFAYLQQGRMKVSDLITHRFSPTEALEVYKMLTTDRSAAMGVIFDWTGL